MGSAAGFQAIVSPAMPASTEVVKRLAVVQVWATVFELAMLAELFGVPPDLLSGEVMVAKLQHTLPGS